MGLTIIIFFILVVKLEIKFFSKALKDSKLAPLKHNKLLLTLLKFRIIIYLGVFAWTVIALADKILSASDINDLAKIIFFII